MRFARTCPPPRRVQSLPFRPSPDERFSVRAVPLLRIWVSVKYGFAPAEQSVVKGLGLRFWLGCIGVVEAPAQPLVGLNRFPPSTEGCEHFDQDLMELFVEGLEGREGLQQGKRRFGFA